MDIRITPQQLADNAPLQQLAVFHLINGGFAQRDSQTGVVTYGFSDQGERMVNPEQFAYLVSIGVEIDKATMFVEMTSSEYEIGAVPVGFPESTFTTRVEEEVVESQRVWIDYAPFSTQSVDGKSYLVQCVHVPVGSPSGMGLGADEFKVWMTEFKDRMLTLAQGEALLTSEKYVVKI